MEASQTTGGGQPLRVLTAFGRKVSDEFTVPLCRGHHREVHRCGDEAGWWHNAGLEPLVAARALLARNASAPN